jgi:hypothetical protein
MLKRFLTLFILSLGITFISFAATNGINGIKLELNKSVLKKNEKLCFTLKNTSNKTVYLPNTAPWVIIGETGKYKGKVVYAPVVAPVITPLKPGEKKQWCWDLKDFNGFSAPSGKYKVRMTLFKDKNKVFLSKPFEIKPLYSITPEVNEKQKH